MQYCVVVICLGCTEKLESNITLGFLMKKVKSEETYCLDELTCKNFSLERKSFT